MILSYTFFNCLGQTVKTDTNQINLCLQFSLDDSISEFKEKKISLIKQNMLCCGIDEFLIDTINKLNVEKIDLSNKTIAMIVDFDEHGKVLKINFPQNEMKQKISLLEILFSSFSLIPNYNIYYIDYYGKLSYEKNILFSLKFDSKNNLIKIN